MHAQRIRISAWVVLLAAASGRGAEVSGRVDMPEVCSPEVSPAVVSLERMGGPPASEPGPGPGAGGRPQSHWSTSGACSSCRGSGR